MLDIEELVRPISDENPVGPDLRQVEGERVFDQIRELKTEYDDARFSPSGQVKEADWRGVVRTCSAALESRSKDLELAASLTEGLCHTEGFAGLRSGLELTLALLTRYWKQLHPGQGPDGLNFGIHMRPLSVLGTGDVLTAVNQIPIAKAPGKDPVGWDKYQMARRRGGVDEASRLHDQGRYQELLAAGYMTSADWRTLLEATPGDTLAALLADLQASQQNLGKLTEFLNAKADPGQTPDEAQRIPADALPTLMPLRDLLDDICGAVQKVAGDGVDPEASEGGSAEEGDEPAVPGSGKSAASGTKGPLTSRADAFRQLQEVAEFLRRTDPHSPVAYLVQRAVRWGTMPLEAVLGEVVKNDEAMQRIQETLGLQAGQE